MVKRIIFLYDAKSGRLAGLVDSLKKVVRSSYACSLCKITHGLVSKKNDWQQVEQALSCGAEYYHRDDMPEEIATWVRENAIRLPAVLFEAGDGGLREAINATLLYECNGAPNCLGSALIDALASEG